MASTQVVRQAPRRVAGFRQAPHPILDGNFKADAPLTPTSQSESAIASINGSPL
jgi:hypothetical protein